MIVHTCAQSYFASTVRLAVFLTKLPYVLLRTSRRWHTPVCSAVSLSLSEVKAEVRRTLHFLLLPFLRGDRPPGNVPDGMSKIKFRSFTQNTYIVAKPPRLNQGRGGPRLGATDIYAEAIVSKTTKLLPHELNIYDV